MTVWQQCLDEETQCYYYWNYETNEVTWEIPVEFSQYLLQYQEYEHALASYERKYAEWKKARHRRKYVNRQFLLDLYQELINVYPELVRLFVCYCGQGFSLLWTPALRPYVGPVR